MSIGHTPRGNTARFVLALALTLFGPISSARTLVVFASQGDNADLANLARRYRTYYRNDPSVEIRFVNLTTNLPYTTFGRQRFGNESIFGRPATEAYDRVLYIIDTHAMETPQGLRLHFDDAEALFTEGSPMLKQLLEHAPRALARDLVLASCNAGAFDPAHFPGDVLGLSPADGNTRELDLSTLNRVLREDRTMAPALSAVEFHRLWGEVQSTDRNGVGHAPFWLARKTENGEIVVEGMRRMGDSEDPIAVAHRRSLATPGPEGMRGAACGEALLEIARH